MEILLVVCVVFSFIITLLCIKVTVLREERNELKDQNKRIAEYGRKLKADPEFYLIETITDKVSEEVERAYLNLPYQNIEKGISNKT